MNGSGVRFDEQLRNLFDSMMKRGYGGGLPWWDHRGFNQVSDGMKMKKSYALFNPLNDNPNQIGSIGGEELVQTLFRKLKLLVRLNGGRDGNWTVQFKNDLTYHH